MHRDGLKTDVVASEQHQRYCYYHPKVETGLRCSRCERPICPKCMVASPVGYRCRDCSRGSRPVLYQASAAVIAKAVAVGVVVAAAVGVLWGFFPSWQFYLALLLGFSVAEGMAWAANYKRGRELQIAAMACVALGLIVSRLVIAYDSPVLTVDMLLNETTNPAIAHAFQLDLIPDVLFMAISFVITYVRFK